MLMLIAGCGSRTVSESFMREDVDFAFVQSIAVLPYENNSKDQYAPTRARDITITQVLAMGLYDVVEKDLVDNFMYNEAIDPGVPLDPLTLKRMGSRLNVQAFLLGTVDVAGDNKLGATTYPEIALTLRLVEAETSMILWQASGHYSGESFGRRLFGVKPDDAYKISFDLVRRLLKTAPSPE
jgi:TolB-like protein